jgi:DHA1 family bicyclomycin/chloramphenicol resistance-like MFS transporter
VRSNRLTFAVLLAALAMLGPFSIDTYMPSFPEIERTFDATPLQLQFTISAFLAPFAVMSLFHGALADSFGRRPVILANLALFVVASAGCALAQAFHQLLWFRAMQGFAGGAGLIVGRAMIRDIFAGADAQRMMSTVTMIFGLAPAIAPIVGGWLQAGFGWRSVFVFLAGYSVLLFAACCWRLPETLPRRERQPFALRPLLANYGRVLGSARFVMLSSAIAFNFSAFFLYIAAAPIVIYQWLGLNERQFAWLFLPGISGIVIGAFISGRVAGRLVPRQTLALGFGVMFAAVACNIAYHAFFAPALPWTVLCVMLYTTGMAITMPTLTLLALDLFPHNRGMAASLQASQHGMFTAITAAAIVPHVADSALAVALTATGLLACGTLCVWIYLRMPKLPENRSASHA